jgi:hypothetical protein
MSSSLPISSELQVSRYDKGIKLIKPLMHNNDDDFGASHTVADLFQLPACTDFSDYDSTICSAKENTAEALVKKASPLSAWLS